MNIIDKIKEFFKSSKKEKTKLLMSGNEEIVNGHTEYTRTIAINPIVNPKEPTLEECIEEFIKQYSLQEELGTKKLNKPYYAFRRMFCNEEEEEGNNSKHQKELKSYIYKKGDHIAQQYSHDRVVFMHIMGEEGIGKKDREVEKLYINCDRKNIALLTRAIYDEIRDIAGDKFQMKCISEQFREEEQRTEEKNRIKNYQRNDRIVIYALNHSIAERMSERINQLRLKEPQLFSKTKTVPLLQQKHGFIGVAKEELGAHAKTPLGYASGQTYNDYLSDIMFQSVVAGFDENTSGTSLGHEDDSYKRMAEYASIFDEMIPEQRQAIIEKSKEIFLNICRENKVNTVYTPIEQEEQKDR